MSEIRALVINVTVDEPAGLVEMSLEDFNRLEQYAYQREAQLERLLSVATDMLTAHVMDDDARAAAIASLQNISGIGWANMRFTYRSVTYGVHPGV